MAIIVIIGLLVWTAAGVNAALDVTSEGRIRTVTTSLTSYFVDNGVLWKRVPTPYVALLLLEGTYSLLDFRRTPLWTLGLMGLTVLAALGLEMSLLQRLNDAVRSGLLIDAANVGPFTLGWSQGQNGPPFTTVTFPHPVWLVVLVSVFTKIFLGAPSRRSPPTDHDEG